MDILRMLGPEKVTARDSFIEHSFRLEVDYLLSLSPERLLAGFRETAGLPTTEERYGGWESTEIQGHTLGHYLTAMAQAWAASKDERISERIEQTVAGLAQCQRADGYLFASPEELFDRVENRQPVWVPWYTMHKLVAGLVAVCRLTDCAGALDVLRRLADWIADRALGWLEETRLTVLAVEYGGMNGCMYDVYTLTGEPRHLQAAHRFDELALLEPIAEGSDILNGLHANTTIPKILGALKGYVVTGGQEPLYLKAAESFWDIVVNHHTYLSGGNSEWEHFGRPDILDAERTACNCETCNTHNMIKLSDLLFAVTGKKKYAAYSTWAFVNTILSSQNHQTGMTTYFQPMATGFFKVYSRPYDQFWCCTGTGMENFTKPWEGIAFERGSTLYINRLISSDITTDAISLSVDADWLHRDIASIEIKSCSGKQSIAVPVPHWAEEHQLDIPEGISCEEQGGFLMLSGAWRTGMTVRLRFAMALRLHGLPDEPNVEAYSYGPFMLSADMGTEQLDTDTTGVDVTVPTRNIPVRDHIIDPVISPCAEPAAFILKSADGWKLTLAPHFLKDQVRYGIYFRRFGIDSPELAAYLAERQRRLDMLSRQYDVIPLGNDQYELAHGVKGERTDLFANGSSRCRIIGPCGYISYMIKVPDVPCAVCLSFDGDAAIDLDGTAVTASHRMTVPEQLLDGEVRITIRNTSDSRELRLFDELYIEGETNE